MARNILKIVEKTKINERYTLSCSEWIGLTDLGMEKPWEAVRVAFIYGYALGQRDLKAKKKNKKPCQRANTDRASR